MPAVSVKKNGVINRASRGAPRYKAGELRRVLKDQQLKWDKSMLAEKDAFSCLPEGVSANFSIQSLDVIDSSVPENVRRRNERESLSGKLIRLGKVEKRKRGDTNSSSASSLPGHHHSSQEHADKKTKTEVKSTVSAHPVLVAGSSGRVEGGDNDDDVFGLLNKLVAEEAKANGEVVSEAAVFTKEPDTDPLECSSVSVSSPSPPSSPVATPRGGGDGAKSTTPQRRKPRKRRSALDEDFDYTPPPPVEFDSVIESTHDATELLRHLADRLVHYEKVCTELSKLPELLKLSNEELNKVHAPISAYMQVTQGAAKRAKCDAALRRVLEANSKTLKTVMVLQRCQTSCAIEVKRLNVVLESLIYCQLSAHNTRQMPGARAQLIKPVFTGVGLKGVDSSKVLRRSHPPPVKSAVDVHHDVSLAGDASLLRVIKATPNRRPSSWLPSWRPGRISCTTLRQHWNPVDTATAHRLARAQASSEAIAEQRAARVIGLLGDGRCGSVIGSAVPQLGDSTTQLYKKITAAAAADAASAAASAADEPST